MKKIFYLSVILVSVAACSSKESKAIDNIKLMESNKSLITSDTLINSYLDFVQKYPEHDQSPGFLDKAANACVRSNRMVKGARLYEKLAMDYPNDSLAPGALISGGVSFDAAKDPANAKRLYGIYLEKYKNHWRYKDVQYYYDATGKSEEQFMEEFLQRVAEKGDSTFIK